tara:strand:+ start:17113 stop:18450 length:1338 start_codon:yes stop_codon:yes gene_type:complete
MKILTSIIFLILSTIFFNSKIISQTVDFNNYNVVGSPITYEDYVDMIRIAVIEQPDYRSLIARQSAYNFDLRYERFQRLPSLSSSVRNDRIIDRKIDDFSSIRKRQDDATDFILELTQPIYLGGTINKRVDNAIKQKQIGTLQLQKQASELTIRANQIFLDLLKYFILQEKIDNSINEIKKILSNIESRIKAGFSNITEKALVQIRLNQLLISQAEINAQLSRSKETFERFFNTKLDNYLIPNLKLENFTDLEGNISRSYNERNSYDVLISEITYKQKKNNIDLTRAEYRPKIGLNFRYIQYDFDEDFNENDIRGGLTFTLPIFNFGRGSKINSAKSKAEESKWEFDSEIRDHLIVRSEIENRLKSILESINDIRSTVENTRQQKEIIINRMSLSEFSGINLSEIILQDVSNTQRLLNNEIQLYIDDLQLSHINSTLLSRFKMDL